MAEPAESIFYNEVMDRTAIKQLISKLISRFGITYTTHILDQLKTLGFREATPEAISLGIDDLLTAPSKGWLIRDAEQYANTSDKHHDYGSLHAVEKLRQLIETWYATSEYLKREMNPNFGVTDPSNPVHMMSFSGARGSTSQVHQLVGMRGLMSDPQGQIIDLPIQSNFREGLSLTEYIISCYGARKGVVDTAVRTSDAGYLTRRLVEVVQHIVVRRTDCGTTRSLFLNNLGGSVSQHRLIGRVLANDIYLSNRCLATRNQDIGTSLANKLLAHKAEAIPVRSPLTCESILWICQLCYGWSLTHGDLIDVGEAVGIIAGQSIGEPGTQLTLRTFHTGGVFAGDIAEHVRTPSNGVVQFDDNLVVPTRTRHGHPAWICRSALSLRIKSQNRIHDLTIPGRSLLLVQNNQYVESKHVIAEIRDEASPFKEKVNKYIYSDLEGEIHWSAKVDHASRYIRGNNHLVLKTSHVWVLAGNLCGNVESPPIFYKDRDEIDFGIPLAKERLIPPPLRGNINKLGIHIFRFYFFSGRRVGTNIPTHRDIGGKYSVESSLVLSGHRVRRSNHSLILSKQEFGEKPVSSFVLQIPGDGILRHNDIIAVSENPKHEPKSSGIIKYGSIGVESINNSKRNEEPERERIIDFVPRYKVVRGGNLFLIPEEIYESPSSFFVGNNSFVEAGTLLTSNTYSRASGFVKIRRKSDNIYELRILSGKMYYPGGNRRNSKQASALLPPGENLFDDFESNEWTYIQWIIPHEGGEPFILVRPAIEIQTINKFADSNLLNFGTNRQSLEIELTECLFYGDGEQVRVRGGKNVRLAQTCLVLHRKRAKFLESAHATLAGIGARKRSGTFLRISSAKYSRTNTLDKYVKGFKSTHNSNHGNGYNSSKFVNYFVGGHRGLIRTAPCINSNRGATSFIVISPANLIKISNCNFSANDTGKENTSISTAIEFFDFEKRSMGSSHYDGGFDETVGVVPSIGNKFVRVILFGGLGFLGHSNNLAKSTAWIIRDLLVSNKYSFIHHYQRASELPKWFFIDEYRRIHRFISRMNRSHHFLNWYFHRYSPSPTSPEETDFRAIGVGQFVLENLDASEYKSVYQSGQVVAIHANHFVIRLAKPYLATGGATVHNNYGELVGGGDTLITLVYERLKSGDIIQGLPKVEQLLEARPINSVSIDLENGFVDWNTDMTKFIGNMWGFLLSSEMSMKRAQIQLVEQIQKVYESQAVHVSDKHVEIIVRQITSKAVTSEDGMNSVFLPGELVEFSRARRMNRALEEAIPYEPILLGVTKASLNTRSFISEASFRETTRVLAKAALRGRTDWLKGLKENVIIGAIIPAGTGSREVIWQITSEKQREFYLRGGRNSFLYEGIGDICSYRTTSDSSTTTDSIHTTLEESPYGGDVGTSA
uniref:DNA-directed RNA polymerase subunit beta'' n=2 Tax=Haplomitrium TaxID=37405 RepID=A0A4Y5P7P7_9MARC|nr:RNA polymerase beta' subunit [Haplomitrium blumei]QCW59317.1 RNA polymerase beta' subunit [Haplomitrium blumei]